ncbi:hypothetical protein J4410_03015 [Candidatus Woesearchaeota archaeon]|nr:hypothetical protein [Candidatus Woesearchaeota archaeon]
MKCYSFVHESLADPVSIAMYMISLVFLGISCYYLIIQPLRTGGVSLQEKIIKSGIFLFLFIIVLIGVPHLREYWLYWVEWCMEVYAPPVEGVVLNITG